MATHVGNVADWPGHGRPSGHRLTAVLLERGMAAFGSVRTPELVRRLAHDLDGERVLAYERGDDGRFAVATDRALHHQDGMPSAVRWVRLGWEAIDTVRWHQGGGALIVTSLVPPPDDRVVLRSRRRPALVELVADRVTSTTQLDVRVALPPCGTARVTVRRPPGTDRMTWLVGWDGPVDTGDLPARAKVCALLAALRSSTGLAAGPTHWI